MRPVVLQSSPSTFLSQLARSSSPSTGRARGLGQTPAPPWTNKTVAGTTYRLLGAAEAARLLSDQNRAMGQTLAGSVSYAGRLINPAATHVTGPGASAPELSSAAWLREAKAAGDAVVATKVGPSTPLNVNGARLPDGTELAIRTREIALVRAASLEDERALVLFEPAAGWADTPTAPTSPPSKGFVYVAALGIGAIAIAALWLMRREG